MVEDGIFQVNKIHLKSLNLSKSEMKELKERDVNWEKLK